MIVTVVPALIDALVQLADDAVGGGVVVSDGFAVTNDPGAYLQIGVEDPDLTGYTTSASATQRWATAGGTKSRDEEGDITCAALGWDGDGDPKAARDGALEAVITFGEALRADPTVGGVQGLLWTEFGSGFELNQAQTAEDGAVAQLLFRIHYRARI